MKKLLLLLLVIFSCQSTKDQTSHDESRYFLSDKQNLLDAITWEDQIMIEKILKKGSVDLNPAPGYDSYFPPLIHAAKFGSLESVKKLLGAGAHINIQDHGGETALLASLKDKNRDESITEYLIREGADVNIPDSWGDAPFSLLCRAGRTELVLLALKMGALIDEPYCFREPATYQYRHSALQEAVQNNHYDIVKILLEKGSNPLLSYSSYPPPVEMAENEGYTEILQLLKEYIPENPLPQITRPVSFIHATEGSEKDFSRDADTIRLNHLIYYGELLKEYFLTAGHYPFQKKSPKATNVFITNSDQQKLFSIKPSEDFTTRTTGEFIKEIERVLKRDVEEYSDPQELPQGLPFFYLYRIEEHRFSFTVFLEEEFPFASASRGVSFHSLELSNLLIPSEKKYTIGWLKNNSEFMQVASRPVFHSEYFEERHRKYLHNSNE